MKEYNILNKLTVFIVTVLIFLINYEIKRIKKEKTSSLKQPSRKHVKKIL